MSRELDARVAREVMEWPESICATVSEGASPWSPSTDMNAAMEVEQKMHDLGRCSFTLMHHHPGGTWTAVFMDCGVLAEAEAATPALAICLAALETGKGDKQ